MNKNKNILKVQSTSLNRKAVSKKTNSVIKRNPTEIAADLYIVKEVKGFLSYDARMRLVDDETDSILERRD